MSALANAIMYAVAAVAALAGIVLLARRAVSEAAVYRQRIASTMLLAFAIILAGFATAARVAI